MKTKEPILFRRMLEDQLRQSLESSGGRELIAIDSPADLFDQIQAATERDLAVGHLERESSRRREVLGALRRLDKGTYGICVDCEEAINPKRLMAIPWTTLCISCRERADRNAPQFEESAQLIAD